MATYPDAIFSPREKENRSDIEYKPLKKTVAFAEDNIYQDDEIVAIEQELGILRLEAVEYTADRSLLMEDAKKLIEMNKATAVNLTVLPNLNVPFPIRTTILFRQKGAGQVTLVAGDGVTLQSAVGLKTSAQYSVGGLIKIATNIWVVMGDLTT